MSINGQQILRAAHAAQANDEAAARMVQHFRLTTAQDIYTELVTTAAKKAIATMGEGDGFGLDFSLPAQVAFQAADMFLVAAGLVKPKQPKPTA